MDNRSNFSYLETLIDSVKLKDILTQASYCTPDEIYRLCLKSVKKHGRSVRDVPLHLLNENICIEAVNVEGYALEDIPVELRTQKVFEAAVKKDYKLLSFLPEPSETQGEWWQHYQRICLSAIKSNVHALALIKEELRTYEMCRIAVTNWYWSSAVRYFPILPELGGDTNKKFAMDLSEYQEACLEGIEKIRTTPYMLRLPVAERLLPNNLLGMIAKNAINKEICLAAINQKWQEIKNVPDELFDADIILAAIKVNGHALQYADRLPGLSQKSQLFIDLCVKAVKKDPLALQYIMDDEIKKQVIDIVTMDRILMTNYKARMYLPKSIDYQPCIDEFLRKIKTVVITNDDQYSEDAEIRDSFLVYAHQEKRLHHTIHTERSDVENLLKDLARYNNPVHLAMIGHTVGVDMSIANVSPENLVQMLKTFKNIERVNLVGCNTVRSKPLAKEKQMLDNMVEIECRREAELKSTKHAFITISNETPLDHKKILTTANTDSAFVLIKDRDASRQSSNYSLLAIKKENNNIMTTGPFPVNETQRKDLQLAFNHNKNKEFTYKKDAIYLRTASGKSPTLVSEKELAKISEITGDLNSVDRFEKAHKNFKELKGYFPDVANVTLNTDTDTEELKNLHFSPLERYITAIQQEPEITQQVTVKGYAKSLHADTKKMRLEATKGHIYTGPYTHSLFHKNPKKRKTMVDRLKLQHEYYSNLKSKQDVSQGKQETTRLRSITVRIKKNKKRNNVNILSAQ